MKYKGCMTEEETRAAWELQDSGMKDTVVAVKYAVCVKTLYRAYRHYGLPRIKRKKKGKVA